MLQDQSTLEGVEFVSNYPRGNFSLLGDYDPSVSAELRCCPVYIKIFI